MKKIFVAILFILGFNSANAVFFGMSNYVIDKDNILKYPKGIYRVYIYYDITGATKTSLNDNCIIQRDASSIQSPECQKDKKGNLLASYMKMENLINVSKDKACVLNIMFFDKSDTLIQTRILARYESCPYAPIPKDTSIDVARKYIIKIEGNNIVTSESKVPESAK